MKIKDLLVPFSFALLITWAIQYFFIGSPESDNQTVQSGQSFKAPKSKQELKPLNTEIDFVDDQQKIKTEKTTIATAWGQAIFSTDGASLDELSFNRTMNGKTQSLTTVYPVGPTQKEQRCFLVALDQKTPFYYQLKDVTETDEQATLTYVSNFGDGTVTKTFVVDKHKHQINLDVSIVPKSGFDRAVEARIFYAAPHMPEIEEKDTISALMTNKKGSVEKLAAKNVDGQGWFAPTLFGSSNKYFVHAMVNDHNGFVQRAYYNFVGDKKLLSIVEGPEITEAKTWKLSFYVGPKEDTAMAPVDPRLEQTLDYHGLLAPVSKLLLKLLKFLYKYLRNYGLAIIVLTTLVRLPLAYFTRNNQEEMRKRAEFQKKLSHLQRKYKHDTEALARARAELIQKHGMPGLGGCLPLLLQLPVFFALSRILSSAIELYQAPFVFWITDLSQPDPYHILPIFIGGSMLLQATTVDAKQRVSMVIMGFVFGIFTMNFSAGLCLYIFVSTLLSVVQTMVQQKLKRA